ncbi:hypothetical protein [Dyella silvatica]|uniref:hypothetical protein n=1 Tax=Dyella silvatica TaxID=2992128 RepID=UPI0022583EFF|nr:hypothetical protein [Dyella silvatica]
MKAFLALPLCLGLAACASNVPYEADSSYQDCVNQQYAHPPLPRDPGAISSVSANGDKSPRPGPSPAGNGYPDAAQIASRCRRP